ncbi:hypothetical protein IV417_12460 [Alphaproteobacteria bacterium KMM 3653]|uniref:Uncharacterized protein n=1 Tax=Harenicola maris TaxID=2841044 RepID=A0AAP2CV13_9RHOB|nr:hypothetical protein [Harenicola maris]
MKLWIGLVALAGLPQCDAESLIKRAHPDRETIEIYSEAAGDSISYICQPGPDLQDRANEAAVFFDAGYREAVDGYAAAFGFPEDIDGMDDYEAPGMIALMRAQFRMQGAIEDLFDETEAQYACLPILKDEE